MPNLTLEEAPVKPLAERAQLLAAANVRGLGLDRSTTVRFILQARSVINELLATLQRVWDRGFHDEEETLP